MSEASFKERFLSLGDVYRPSACLHKNGHEIHLSLSLSYLLLFWLLNFSIFDDASMAMSKCGLNIYVSIKVSLDFSAFRRAREFINGNFFNYFSNWRRQWHKQPVFSISTPKIAKERGREGDCDVGYILQHTFSQRASQNGKMELIKIFIDFYFYLSRFFRLSAGTEKKWK